MSLDKAILHGKENRQQYKGAKLIDNSCRNGKDCPWCTRNRKFAKIRQQPAQQEDTTDAK